MLSLFGLPYFYGTMLEKNYNNYIQSLNENEYLKGIVQFKGQINRGLFGGKAVTEVSMGAQSVQLLHDIKFGPFLFGTSIVPQFGTLGVVTTTLTGDVQKSIEALYKDKQPYKFITSVSTQGNIDTALNINPVNVDLGYGAIGWQGMYSRIISNVNDHSFSVNLTLPLLDISEQQSDGVHSVSFTNAHLTVTKDSGEGAAKVEFDIDTLKVDSPVADEKVDAANYTSSFNYTLQNDQLDSDVSIKFDKLTTSGLNFGPFNLQLNLTNWNLPALLLMVGQAAEDPDVEMQALQKLLSNKINLNLNLTFDSSLGSIDAISQIAAGDPALQNSASPDQVLATINSTQTIQISSKLLSMFLARYAAEDIARQARRYYFMHRDAPNPYNLSEDKMKAVIDAWIPTALQQLTAQKYLLTDGDVYMCKIDYANSAFAINGVTIGSKDLANLVTIFTVIQPPAETGAPSTSNAPVDQPAVPQTAPTNVKMPAGA